MKVCFIVAVNFAAAGGTGAGGSGVGGGSLVRTPSVKISSVGLMPPESVLFVGESVLFAAGVGTGSVLFAGVGAG